MQFKTAKKWFIPYGTWIIMTHDEACWLTSNVSLDVITGAISAIGTVYAAAAAIQIQAQGHYIRNLNEQSGGKGVKLLFVWATGMIMSIERLGRGTSPCSVGVISTGGAGGSSGSSSGGGGYQGPGGPHQQN